MVCPYDPLELKLKWEKFLNLLIIEDNNQNMITLAKFEINEYEDIIALEDCKEYTVIMYEDSTRQYQLEASVAKFFEKDFSYHWEWQLAYIAPAYSPWRRVVTGDHYSTVDNALQAVHAAAKEVLNILKVECPRIDRRTFHY